MKFRLLCLFLFVAACTPSWVQAENPVDAFEALTYTSDTGGTLPYRLYKPEKIAPGQKYPVLIFLHGAGQRGDDNVAQMHNAPVGLIKTPQSRETYGCYMLVPQCPHGKQWVDMNWGADRGTQPAQPSEMMQMVLNVLDQLVKQPSVDPDRIYVMGLSMGGYGVWDLITRYPDRFAAAAPCCGGGDEAVAARAKAVPIWAFHSSDDKTVKVIRSRNMIATIEAAGGHPHYFEYSGLGHGCWGKAFSEPELFPWMFSQRRGKPDAYALKTQPPMPPAQAPAGDAPKP